MQRLLGHHLEDILHSLGGQGGLADPQHGPQRHQVAAVVRFEQVQHGELARASLIRNLSIAIFGLHQYLVRPQSAIG